MGDSEVGENDVAIVGMAIRVPGAQTPSQFWRNLHDGVESITRLDESTLLDAGESAELVRHPNYVPACGLLENMKMFDGDFFGFSPKESAILDPQHRHFMECAWEALEDAGHPPEKFEGQVGVFAGCGMGSYFYFNVCSNRDLVDSVGLFLLRHTGNDKDFLATRVSYLLDLRGPAVNVQTACSTSLVATHMACQSLLSGESDMALAGGVTIMFPHERGYLYHEGEILSPDGHCHAFDHRAQGTVLTSGAGVVALRRLEDAIEDGDHIYSVIKGSAINNDGGRKVGYLAPSVDGQAAAMTEAYAVADIDPASIEYVECHGTGTYMGDPIEVSALTQTFRRTTEAKGFCRIASVKSNIGHLDTAAGVASLIKASLSLENEAIAPTISFEKPNPVIGFEETPFLVNDALHPWPRQAQPRRAAVNSLGVGGTNAHVILEEAPVLEPTTSSSGSLQLVRLSARNNKSLEGNTQRLADFLRERSDVDLADVAYTLDVGRREMGRRRVLVARSREEAIEILQGGDPSRLFTHSAPDCPVSVVFMFSGAASQYPGMALGLYEEHPVFREELDRGIELASRKTGYDFRRILLPGPEDFDHADKEFTKVTLQLPGIFILEHALARLWMSWGVRPDFMIGHSMGENTAACIAGVLSMEAAVDLLVMRGKLQERTAEGAMVSVALSEAELRPLLLDECDLALVNAPELCVASGTSSAIESLEKRLQERDVEYRRVPFSRAAHSRLFDPILDDFRRFLETLELNPPEIPFVSNRTGKIITDAQATDPGYWVEHLRHTVRFADGLDTILETPGRLLIEVGPSQSLCAFARQHPKARQRTNIIPSLRHRDDSITDEAFFLSSLGRAWASGLAIDLSRLREGEVRRRVSLPTYAWSHQPYFIEPTEVLSREGGEERLDRIEDVAEWGRRPVWLRTPIEEAHASVPSETWLVFMDDAGIGHRLKKNLIAENHRVVSVHAGDAYHKRSDLEYTLAPELGRAGYDALLQDLVAHGLAPTRIVHLWEVTATEKFRPGSSFFHQNIQDGFYSLYFLAQAIGEESLPTPLHITVVSNGMQSVLDGESLAYPEKATLLGPVKVIPRELTGVTCKSVDIALPRERGLTLRELFGRKGGKPSPPSAAAGLDDIAEMLTREVQTPIEVPSASPSASAIVAYRGFERFVRGYENEPLRRADAEASSEVSTTLRKGGTYLITGGLGGLGLNLADRLARDYQPNLVLVGRSAMPAREEWDEWLRTRGGSDPTGRRIRKVRDLEALGAQIEIQKADVTNLEEMQAAIEHARSRFGRIHGFFHTAGIVKDELIQIKLDRDVEEVFGPKVHGTLVLDALLERAEAELFVLFSSTSAIAAPAGQVDYAGANAFLDAYAQSRAGSPVRTLSINWGIWNQVGMAAEGFGEIQDAGADELEATSGPIAHPLFSERVRDSHGRSVFQKNFETETDWVLDEHRTRRGQALLPGTGYPELVWGALSEYGETGPFEIRDLYFIRPLHVPDGQGQQVRVALRRFERGYRFEVRTACHVDSRQAWALNAQATVEFRSGEPPSSLDLDEIETRCREKHLADDPTGHRTGQEQHVAFGPRWRVLREAVYGKDEALARLELPDRFAADLEAFGLHPAMLDLATGYAMDLIADYRAEEGLWVPVSYARIAVFDRLPKCIRSWVRNRAENRADRDFAVFDVTITDPEGRVLLEIEEFTIKKLSEEPDFARIEAPAATDVEFEASVGVATAGREPSPAERQLRWNYERGIRPEEGTEALMRVLAAPHRPQVVVSSLDLSGMIRQVEKGTEDAKSSGTKFSRPDLDSELVEPRDEIERTLVGYWEELLGVDSLGVRDSFFDLGGHSLIAVRLFTMIKRAYKVEFPISVLFEAPTIEGCANLIREAIGEETPTTDSDGMPTQQTRRTRYKYLVPMDGRGGEGGSKPPFFLVAGMFGNVLNLRHLANLVGTDRSFYGLQARGLYGDEPPHETFEEMATAYLEEIRTVQPEGPYFIGGFSGGGITAFEMAHQLRAVGEDVALLVLLDTILPVRPPLSKVDRARVQWQRVRRRGAGYITEWARNRVRWEMEQLKIRLHGENIPERSEDQFHNEAIEKAFRAALPHYRMKHYDGAAVLFRPKLDRAYVLGPDRVLDSAKEWVFPDNGYGDWIGSLEVFETPGNHDSMVLEPNVRVMAAQLRTLLQRFEKNLQRIGTK